MQLAVVEVGSGRSTLARWTQQISDEHELEAAAHYCSLHKTPMKELEGDRL